MAILLKAIYSCNHHQNSKDIFCRDRKINYKVLMEAQMTLDGHSIPEQKGQTILQSYINENSMVLAQKQTCRPME
jgi:hypothetical protein